MLLSGTDIILWHGKTGKIVGNVDTNQLKNNMAAISPNGRFVAAAAFTADVKVKTPPIAISINENLIISPLDDICLFRINVPVP